MPYDPRRTVGYHPPYCTCYDCNEARQQQGQQDGKRRQSAAALRDAVASPPYRRRRRGGSALRLFRLLRLLRLFRSVAATALFCTVLIHVAVFAGILAYVGVQEGAPDGVLPMVADTFTSAREAYVGAWQGP